MATTFDRTESQIRELLIEYILYQKALSFSWTKSEQDALLSPSVQFNPPIRFLQTKGHKEKVGISYDTGAIQISFKDLEAEKKFRHLISKLVISPKTNNLKATSTYDAVFADYPQASVKASKGAAASTLTASSAGAASSGAAGTGQSGSASPGGGAAAKTPPLSAAKKGTLFVYPVTVTNALLTQLMNEAKELSIQKYPAAATFLLRNIVESVLRHIIDSQKANAASKRLDLESAINLCVSTAVSLPREDVKVLAMFQKQYVNYLNLGAHGNLIPNDTMVIAARDCIDVFIKKNI